MASNQDLKPITLYNHASGPNPWKVVMTLNTLSIPYENSWVDFANMKSEPYISVNPNGRVPAIEDPNTGITLWESGAIIQYLVEKYDPTHKISFPHGSKASHYANQWLFFQVSGQGPYYGQAAWFQRFHPEKIPSAIERYQKEAERVAGVIDLHLSRNGLKYLVADEENKEGKFSFADLSFVPWGGMLEGLNAGRNIFEGGKYAAYREWFERVNEQPGVKDAVALKAELNSKSSH